MSQIENRSTLQSTDNNLLLKEYQAVQFKFEQRCQSEAQLLQENAVAKSKKAEDDHKIKMLSADKALLQQQLEQQIEAIKEMTQHVGQLKHQLNETKMEVQKSVPQVEFKALETSLK